MPAGIRVDDSDPDLHNIRAQWSEGLKAILQQFDVPPDYYFK